MSPADAAPLGGADDDRARAANPGSDPLLLARLAEERPELHELLAGNPSSPVYILEWLHSLSRPEIDRALEQNRTAVIMGIVTPPPGMPFAPPVGTPLAPPAGAAGAAPPAVPPTVVLPVTPAPPAYVVAEPSDPIAAGSDPVRTGPVAIVGSAGGSGSGGASTVVDEPDDDAEDRGRRRGMGLLIAVVPLLFLGGCLAAIALARGPSDTADDASAKRTTASTVRAAVLPTQVTRPSTPTTVRPGSAASGAATTGAASSAAATSGAAAPATEATEPATDATDAAPATEETVPATARPTAATAAKPAATTVKPTTTVARATTLAAAPVQATAWTTAQELAGALARGDWAKARKLTGSSMTDAQYAADYGNLDDSTVVQVSSATTGPSTYALKLGLVAHETNGGVKQTALYCARWSVDTAKSLVTQTSGTTLRKENGTKSAASYTAELVKSCA